MALSNNPNQAKVVKAVKDLETNKQDALVSGTNIKTINNESILGSGNITIGGGGGSIDVQVDSTSITSGGVANLKTINGDYDASTNKLATENDLPTINLTYEEISPSGTINPFDDYYNKSYINSLANSKANIALDNVSPTLTSSSLTAGGRAGTKYSGSHIVIESWKSTDGTMWYRKWSDGFKECGLYDRQRATKIDLPIVFSNISYTAVVTEDNGSATTWGGTSNPQGIYNKTTSSLYIGSGSGVQHMCVYCCGY